MPCEPADSVSQTKVKVMANLKVMVKVKKSIYRPTTGPRGSRRLRLPDFETIST